MQHPFVRTPRTLLAYLALGYYGYLINGLGPVLPFLRTDLHLSYAEGSLHTSAFALGMLIAGLLGDGAVHRFGRYRTMIYGLWGLAGGSVLLVAGRSVVFTLGGALLMGSLGTLVLVLVPAIVADEEGPYSAVALNEANVVSSTCAVMAPLVVGSLAHTALGWRAAFLLGSLLIVPIAPRLRGLLKQTSAESGHESARGDPLPPAYLAYWNSR